MSETPFDDPQQFVAIPRVAGLRLSPDGRRLVTGVSELSADGKHWVTALWSIDPEGGEEPRRLTRSAPGDTSPEFLPGGDLLFLSRRADPDTADDADSGGEAGAGLWLLPAGGGEARKVLGRPGGISDVAVARDTGTVAVNSPVFPGAEDAAGDEERRKARRDAGITALLHEGYPIRNWDHDLGPAEPRLLIADGLPADAAEARDLTPDPGRALDEQHFELSPDGRTLVTGWYVYPGGQEEHRSELVAIDTETGQRRVLASDPDDEFHDPAVSPDGRFVVCGRVRRSTYDEPSDHTLWLIGIDGTGGHDLLPDLDLWPAGPAWSPDGRHVFFVADRRGRRPVFRVELESGQVDVLTGDDGAYAQLVLSPDGTHVYAIRDAIDEPPTPVRLNATATGGQPERLPAPGLPVRRPGTLTEVTTHADDGQELRAWLFLPDQDREASPAPMLVWIHGGPLSSWNHWNWRWTPWVAAARGYAVLLPDPALSTGYGLDFIRRGHGAWGDRPYTDLMALTDAAAKRDDIDETRTGAMGGSFGGYMANWVAGHTDRFRAIVTHASLWALDQMKATTDVASYWRREFGDIEDPDNPRYARNSPHHHVRDIRTPMLVVHGDKDYRVPVSEALRLWWDLTRHEVDAKFLYFPDENHWVLHPGEAALWYETVLAFMDHHVCGEPWRRPALV